MDKNKAIIIGSGVGGLSIAIRLAIAGYQVAVFEKNEQPGGKLSAFKSGGYSFDSGPSLFTQPQNIEELFLLAREPMEDYFTYQQVPVACKYFYENGKIVEAHSDPLLFAAELKHQLKENPDNIISYLKKSENTYNNIGNIFLNNSLHKRKTWFSPGAFNALKSVRFGFVFKSLHKYNKQKLSSPEAVQLFDRFATYNGSNPYKAPAMLSLIPHLEQNEGTFFPDGGMISITNALYRLAIKLGVTFQFNSEVQRIINMEGRAVGVVVNNQNYLANVVVSNVDVYFTYKNLLNDAIRAKKILKQERSSSAIIFYWGIKKQFPALQLHNILFSKDYHTEFDTIFNKKSLGNDPTIYINITSKIEKGQSPADTENWFVMVNAPANTGQNWVQLKIKVRADIISKLNRMLNVDMESLIETEHSLDPVSIESKTASYMGSLYGTSSNSRLAAFFRPANFTNSIKGLYFCGGSVHPGGGIPLCLKSAKIVAGIIINDSKKASH